MSKIEIDKKLKERIKDITEILQAEDKIEALNDYALALTKYELYVLELSYGGPSDYIEFKYDKESRTLVSIKYCYYDWGDGAVRAIEPHSNEWKILSELFYSCILIE